MEVEMAWGFAHKKKIDSQKVTSVSINVREILDSILGMLEKYRVPVTWAFLGHLLLDHCSRDSDGLPHSDMPRPRYSWLKNDWYSHDPCSDIEREPAWYGKDVIERIVKHVRQSSLPHDIGCHSFSHQMFGDPGCGEELARAEISKCVELMTKEYGLVPKVFSFPRDYVGHLDVLKELGFVAFRDAPTKLYPCLELDRTLSTLVKKYLSLSMQFLSYYLLLAPHVVTPSESLPGLWGVAGCLAYNKKPLIPLRLGTVKAIKGIKSAIRDRKVFCMYMHLRDFGEAKHLLWEFERILSYVNEKRVEGVLEVKTMTQLVRELEDASM